MAILLIVQHSYGLGVEAVKEPFGPRLGAPVPAYLAVAERTVCDLGDWSLTILWAFL